MGSVVTRGTRDNPKHFVKYRDIDGRWKMRLSFQPTKAQAKKYLAEVEARIARGLIGIPEPEESPRAGELMATWAEGLINRNAADDRRRIAKHLKPVFGHKRMAELQAVGAMLAWIDDQRRQVSPTTKKKLAEASIRHNLNLLSRFFAWAIERGHTAVNPVRQIPQGKRPQQAQKRDVPWLKDDVIVRQLVSALPEPVNLMFYIGNRSGLRTGEIAALRMADMDFLKEGVIRVRFSYGGPLKEDKKGTGKMKWVPAADDADAVLGPWLKRRRAQGAGPEALVFECASRDGSWYRKEFVEACWEKVAPQFVGTKVRRGGDGTEKTHVALTWYEATRHSFTTRLLEAGASLDEVSAALGHSSPVVTRRYYDHFIRRSFSGLIRGGLGLGATGGDGVIIDIRDARQADEAGNGERGTNLATDEQSPPVKAR